MYTTRRGRLQALCIYIPGYYRVDICILQGGVDSKLSVYIYLDITGLIYVYYREE